jgi:hypothetical protein
VVSDVRFFKERVSVNRESKRHPSPMSAEIAAADTAGSTTTSAIQENCGGGSGGSSRRLH